MFRFDHMPGHFWLDYKSYDFRLIYVLLDPFKGVRTKNSGMQSQKLEMYCLKLYVNCQSFDH